MMTSRGELPEVGRVRPTIALVGLPGVGKTRVGRALAERLGLPFLDSDAEIEASAGLDVAEIFRREGEEGFRRRERAAIRDALDGPPKVLALGGGGFEDETTRALLLSRATVIWLDAPDPVLLPRLARAAHRPLFAGRGAGELLARLRQARTPAYAQAHHRVVASTSGALLDAILPVLGE